MRYLFNLLALALLCSFSAALNVSDPFFTVTTGCGTIETRWTSPAGRDMSTLPNPVNNTLFFGHQTALSGDGSITATITPPFNASTPFATKFMFTVFFYTRPSFGQEYTLTQSLNVTTVSSVSSISSIAFSRDSTTLAVGMAYEMSTPAKINGAGVVFMFRLVDGVWTQQNTIQSPSSVFGYNFGWGLAFSQSSLFIGAPGAKTNPLAPSVSNIGIVYEFQWNESAQAYQPQQSLVPLTEYLRSTTYDIYFGRTIQVTPDGLTLFISSPNLKHPNNTRDAGAVWVFARSSVGTPFQFVQIIFEVEREADYSYHTNFGEVMVLSGDGETLMIAGNQQAVLYTRQPNKQYTPVTTLAQTVNDQFSSVTLSGDGKTVIALMTNAVMRVFQAASSSSSSSSSSSWQITEQYKLWSSSMISVGLVSDFTGATFILYRYLPAATPASRQALRVYTTASVAVSSYQVECGTPYNVAVNSSVLAYNFTGVSSGWIGGCSLLAIINKQTYAYSPITTYTNVRSQPPPAVSSFTAIPTLEAPGSFRFSWTSSVPLSPSNAYQVVLTGNNGFGTRTLTAEYSSTTPDQAYVVIDVTQTMAAKQYQFSLTPINSCGTGQPLTFQNVLAQMSPREAYGLYFEYSCRSVHLVWSSASSNGYPIRSNRVTCEGADGFEDMMSPDLGALDTEYEFTGIDNWTGSCFVTSYSTAPDLNIAVSDSTEEMTVYNHALNAPYNLTYVFTSSTRIQVNWDVAVADADDVSVELTILEDGQTVETETINRNQFSISITEASRYLFALRARNVCGLSRGLCFRINENGTYGVPCPGEDVSSAYGLYAASFSLLVALFAMIALFA